MNPRKKLLVVGAVCVILGFVLGGAVGMTVMIWHNFAEAGNEMARDFTYTFERLASRLEGTPRSAEKVRQGELGLLAAQTINMGMQFNLVPSAHWREEVVRVVRLIDAHPELQHLATGGKPDDDAAKARRCILEKHDDPVAVVICTRKARGIKPDPNLKLSDK